MIKFKEINSINELMKYKGCLIFTEEQTIRENLEEDEFLIDELTGLEVYDLDGEKVGVVVGVCNNGISDFISVKSKTKKVSLVPFVIFSRHSLGLPRWLSGKESACQCKETRV